MLTEVTQGNSEKLRVLLGRVYPRIDLPIPSNSLDAVYHSEPLEILTLINLVPRAFLCRDTPSPRRREALGKRLYTDKLLFHKEKLKVDIHSVPQCGHHRTHALTHKPGSVAAIGTSVSALLGFISTAQLSQHCRIVIFVSVEVHTTAC